MPAPIIQIAPHTEAAAIIRQKPILSQAVFNELLPELKSRAFVISGLEHFDTLQEVQDLLGTLPEGANWDDVKGNIIEKISPWFTPKAAERRAEFLLRTHGYQAYAVSNYRSLEESKDLFPFRQYLSSEDPRVRPAHAALHRRVFPADSPFWNTHTPPWEWGCRCDVVGLTADEAMEIKASDDHEKDAGKRLFMDGPLLESVENSNVLHIGNGHTFNVSTPFEKGSGYLFDPGSLHMNVTALAARYSPEVWSEFQQWASKTKIDSLGKTVWQWLAHPVKWKPAKGPHLTSFGSPDIVLHRRGESLVMDEDLHAHLMKVATGTEAVPMPPLKAQRGWESAGIADVEAAERELAKARNEHLRVWDALGNPVLSKQGLQDQVSAPPEILKAAISLHNHPQGTPPSLQDIQTLSETEGAQMRVITKDWLYVMEPGDRWPGPAWDVANDPTRRKALHEMTFIADEAAARMGWSEEKTKAEFLHLVWYRLAQAKLINYHRISRHE